jgi:hypothetical protein
MPSIVSADGVPISSKINGNCDAYLNRTIAMTQTATYTTRCVTTLRGDLFHSAINNTHSRPAFHKDQQTLCSWLSLLRGVQLVTIGALVDKENHALIRALAGRVHTVFAPKVDVASVPQQLNHDATQAPQVDGLAV